MTNYPQGLDRLMDFVFRSIPKPDGARMRPDELARIRDKLQAELRPRIGVELWDYGDRLGVAITIGSGAKQARLECQYPSTMDLSEIVLDVVEHFRTRKSQYAMPTFPYL
jgi:hypothetical protein